MEGSGLGSMRRRIARLPRQFRALLDHPFNRDHRVQALHRWLCWQIGARLVPGPVLVPFVNGTRLVATPGLTGVTGNIFYGLAEMEDMAFALHLLRPADLFVDVGANAGSYTVLAASVGARVVAVEPVPAASGWLELNIRVNDMGDRVRFCRCGISEAAGELVFTTDRDTMNRVAAPGEPGIGVPVITLDELLRDAAPRLIKIDVEGHEPAVMAGAARTLAQEDLLALIIEVSQPTIAAEALVAKLRGFGFSPYSYDPFERCLEALSGLNPAAANTIFIRDAAAVARRVAEAPAFRLPMIGP